jgi:hypothetical protein
MNDLQLAALAFAIVAVLVLLAVARWIGEGIPEQLHAQAPFDPAKTAGGCAGKSWGAYAAPVNPDRDFLLARLFPGSGRLLGSGSDEPPQYPDEADDA